MKTLLKIFLFAILLGSLFFGVRYFVYSKKQGKNVELRMTRSKKRVLEIVVTASGYIQPVTKVTVGTQVSGIVKKLYVDYNSQVEKGQLLAELDKSTLSEKVLQCKSSLGDAESNLLYAKQNYERVKHLYEAKAATEVQMEEATNKYEVAKNAKQNARANLNQAMVNLGYADIYSPIAGRVLSRSVDEGQTVAASFNTPTLFTIANDLTKMQIEADVDEADIGRIKVGQEVSFEVDTYSGEKFAGVVEQIRLEPTVTSNVVTYTVVISAPNPEEKLLPGMTANVSITTQANEGICVLSEALYFKPKQEELPSYTIKEDAHAKGNKVWTKRGKTLTAIPVTVGASDGIRSIILSGINEGEEIVLGIEKKVDLERGASLFKHPGTNKNASKSKEENSK